MHQTTASQSQPWDNCGLGMESMTMPIVLETPANLLSGGFLYQAGMIMEACTEAGWELMGDSSTHKATDVLLLHKATGRTAVLSHSAATGNLVASGTSIEGWAGPVGKSLLWEQTMLALLGKDSNQASRVQWSGSHKAQVRKDWEAVQALHLWLNAETSFQLVQAWLAAEASHKATEAPATEAPKPVARKPRKPAEAPASQ
jgi:hypothetical protein